MFAGKKKKPIVCIILDGWGIGPPWGGNAISQAKTRNFDIITQNYPFTTLSASGTDVGLPSGSAGNSEAGHLTMGAGKVVHQDTVLIEREIESGAFFKNSVIIEAVNRARTNKSKLHLMGLLSKAGTHSDIKYLYALLKLIKAQNFNDVFIHLFSDGRDSPPMSGIEMVEEVEKNISEIGVGSIASISGRFYAMDRDGHIGRITRVYNMLVKREGEVFKSARQAFSAAYASGMTDEFIIPRLVANQTQNITSIRDHDSVILFNFRADRSRELTQAFLALQVSGFSDRIKLKNLYFASFVTYDETNLARQVFEPEKIDYPLARIWSEKGLKQYHTAETEKYAHITYYLNGGVENPFRNEDRLMIPSPKKFSTYDLCPQMSAEKVTQTLVNAINKGKYDCLMVNFANADMVGHTGNLRSTIHAVEFVDKCLGEVLAATLNLDGVAFILADHGNAEQMVNPHTGNPDTEHSTNPVPFVLFSNRQSDKYFRLKNGGTLASLAPTILDFMEIENPTTSPNESLLIRGTKS